MVITPTKTLAPLSNGLYEHADLSRTSKVTASDFYSAGRL